MLQKEREREREREGGQNVWRSLPLSLSLSLSPSASPPSLSFPFLSPILPLCVPLSLSLSLSLTLDRRWGQGTRQCQPKVPHRFAFPAAWSPKIWRMSRFGKEFPNFPVDFPWEPRKRSRKQPQSRVFDLALKEVPSPLTWAQTCWNHTDADFRLASGEEAPIRIIEIRVQVTPTCSRGLRSPSFTLQAKIPAGGKMGMNGWTVSPPHHPKTRADSQTNQFMNPTLPPIYWVDLVSFSGRNKWRGWAYKPVGRRNVNRPHLGMVRWGHCWVEDAQCYTFVPLTSPCCTACVIGLSETFRWPQPPVFSKSTAVQMGGVLPYKWEVYCSTNGRRIAGFPFIRSLEARKVRRYKWGAYLGNKRRWPWPRFPQENLLAHMVMVLWKFLSGKEKTKTMTKISSKKTCYTYGHGPLINLLQYCRTNWRCTAVLFRQVVRVGVSEKLPSLDSVPRDVSRAVWARGSRVSKKCLESVAGVSKRCPGHSGRGHSRDTFLDTPKPMARNALQLADTPWDTPSDTPVFADTLGTNINKFGGLSRDCVGGKNVFKRSLRGIPSRGKHINKILGKSWSQSYEDLVNVLHCFFASVPNFCESSTQLLVCSCLSCLRRFRCLYSGESHRPLTPIFLKSIAIHLPFLSRYFCKSMPSSWQKVVYTPPIWITIRLPFVSRYFCRSITGLAPRIFFIFAPLLREEGGGGSEGRGHFSKIRGKRGKKWGGGGGGVDAGGIFGGGEGSLIFILRVEEPP